MTNKQIVISALFEYGCQNSKSIAAMANRLWEADITPSEVSGALRPLIKAGIVGNSNCGYGSTVYWINEDMKDEARKMLKEGK